MRTPIFDELKKRGDAVARIAQDTTELLRDAIREAEAIRRECNELRYHNNYAAPRISSPNVVRA